MKAGAGSWIKTLLKIAFVIGLLYFLSRKGFLSAKETGQALVQWRFSGPVALTIGLATVLGAFRWQLLLRAQGVRLDWGRTLRLTLIGNFFNVALPGAVSGDFVKAFYVGKEAQGQRARAFGSILFDRVVGLSALVFVSAFALVTGYKEFGHSAVVEGTRIFVVLGAAGVFVFYCYLFLVREHHDPFLRLLRALQSRAPRAAAVTGIYEGLRHYHNHRGIVLQTLALSLIIQLLIGWVCWEFAAALGVTGLSPLAFYVVVPLGLLVTAVPVAPAGVGTGHAAFLFLFGLLGCKRGADIFSLYAVTNILLGAVGGLVYLRFRGHEATRAREAGDFQ